MVWIQLSVSYILNGGNSLCTIHKYVYVRVNKHKYIHTTHHAYTISRCDVAKRGRFSTATSRNAGEDLPKYENSRKIDCQIQINVGELC